MNMNSMPFVSRWPELGRVLLVEDNPRIAEGVTGTLEAFGYSVYAPVDNGEDAVHRAEELIPDIILMDINLKGEMDGIDATRMINSKCSIPVLYLTARSDVVTSERARSTKNSGYVLKPFDGPELLGAIENALARRA